MADLTIDVRMEPTEDDDGGGSTETGVLRVRVSNQDGNPIEGANVTVEAVDGSYSNTKPSPGFGTATKFEDVPNKDVHVTIEATGYQTIEIEVSADDWGGSDITRGY